MAQKTINSKKYGQFLFHTLNKYIFVNGRQCTDKHGNALTCSDDGEFLAVVKKYYSSIVRQRKKLGL